MTIRLRSVIVLAALAVGVVAPRARADTLIPFTAVLNGAQETPPNNSPSQGVALVNYDVEQNLLCYALSYSPLGSAELVAHFHAPGAPTQSAPILFPITPSPSPIGSPKQGCVGPLAKTDLKNLKKGLFYLNVHSANFPAGEIRGQVLPEKVRFKGVPTTTTVSTSTTATTSSTSTTISSVTGAFVGATG